jgi:catechol-2,3-dioxygenase
MEPDLRLGHLVFEVRRLVRWEAFCQQMLGLPITSTTRRATASSSSPTPSRRRRRFVGAVSSRLRNRRVGLGHAVLVAHDLPPMEAFYAGILGFGVTERRATRVGPIDFRGVFLHCNQRHHSLALFDLPLRRRLHHFMLQAAGSAILAAPSSERAVQPRPGPASRSRRHLLVLWRRAVGF